MDEEYAHMWELFVDYLDTVLGNYDPILIRRMLTFIRRRAPKELKKPIRSALGNINCSDNFQLDVFHLMMLDAPEDLVRILTAAFTE